MGRRRRRVIRIIKKKLPTVFVCPKCGEEAVRVTIAKDTGKATVMCAMCQLKDEFQAHPAAQMIDIYSYFTDRFYGVKDPRPIMPRQRETPSASPEEEVSEPEPIQALKEPSGLDEPEAMAGNHEPALEHSSLAPELTETEAPIAQVTEEASQDTPSEPAEAAKLPEMQETPVEDQPTAEEDNEPFADILQNKDKKRYSPNPLPEQHSE